MTVPTQYLAVHRRVMEEAKCWTWRRELICTRIRELNDSSFAAFTAGRFYYGTPERLRELMGDAIKWLEREELDGAERLCELAEIELIKQRRAFRSHHGT